MRVDKFVRNVMTEINAGCRAAKVKSPEKVEFLIRLDDKGFVCEAKEPPVSEIKVTVFNETNKEGT